MNRVIILCSLLIATACTSYTARTTAYSPIQSMGKPVGDISFVIDRLPGGKTLLTARSSDGEVFTGVASGETNQHQVDNGEGVNCTTHTDKDGQQHQDCHVYDRGTSVQTVYTGLWFSTLIGNRGNSMECTFSASNAGDNFVYGGVGNCQISDGRIVPVSITEPVVLLDENGKIKK